MWHVISAVALAGTFGLASAVAQSDAPSSAGGDTLATVRITESVLAGGKPLPAGTYQLRLTSERPEPLPGQSPDAQRWVEFVADERVVAREIAEVLRDDDPTPIGASSQPVRDGARVEMLRGGEFLRISFAREGERYLIHLPVAP